MNDVAKKNLETKLSQITSAKLQKKTVPTLGRFSEDGNIIPWNSHNVTGSEANRLLVKPLQDIIIKQNTNISDLYDIAKSIYEFINVLDKEYIIALEVDLKAAKEASDQALDASHKAKTANEEIQKSNSKIAKQQTDLNNAIKSLSATVGKLKEIKEELSKRINSNHQELSGQIRNLEKQTDHQKVSIKNLENFTHKLSGVENQKHFGHIDKLWDNVEETKTDLNNFQTKIKSYIDSANIATDQIRQNIETLQQYRKTLESQTHINEVDTMWNEIEKHENDLKQFHQSVAEYIKQVTETTEKIIEKVVSLQEYRQQLEKVEHLGDVDTIWSQVTKLEQENIQTQQRYQYTNKRIKIAYGVAGASVTLSLVQLMLQLIGVL